MRIIDKGSGPPLVLIPRLEGRWEFMGRAIDALARSFRVITFPLCGEPDADAPYEPARGLDDYVAQVGAVLDRVGVDRAVVCGVSFGAVVAVQFAAAHPARTTALVVATAPEPLFHLKRRHSLYARAPWLFGPVFLFEAQRRLRPELKAAIPAARDRIRFALDQARTFVGAPISLGRMAARARLISTLDLTAECVRIAAPTLVITGEAALDKVVPSNGSSDYVRLIAGARQVVLERTGHQGVMTRPEAFAALVADFAKEGGALGSNAA